MVDEKALHQALTSGKLSGAGIDVFEKEPTPADNPLLKLENIVVLPHMAAETFESAIAVAMCCARQVMAVMADKTPENLLNP
jgi:phosphoglycerate dehydrogenase-like enzyme